MEVKEGELVSLAIITGKNIFYYFVEVNVLISHL